MKNAFGCKQSFGSVLLIQIITNPSLIYVSVSLDYAIDKSKVTDSKFLILTLFDNFILHFM